MGRIFRGVWDCPRCGRTDISITEDRCPGCGGVRDKNTTYRAVPEREREYVTGEEEANARKGQDWKCSYCERLNHAWQNRCECGASKEESDANYFELKVQEKKKQEEIKEREQQDERERLQSELDNNTIRKATETGKDLISSLHDSIGKVFAGFGFLLLAILLVWSLLPKPVTLTVDTLQWEYTVNIDELKTLYENDWSLPSGARLDRTAREVSGQKRVEDGTELVTKTRYVQVQDGYTTRDLGNGYFEEVPKYKTVPETYTELETKYKWVDVYSTKYYYYIDRYVYERSVKTSGTDKDPYFGDVILEANEKESGRSKAYKVYGKIKNKDISYDITEETWKMMFEGQVYDGKVSFGYFKLEEEKGK